MRDNDRHYKRVGYRVKVICIISYFIILISALLVVVFSLFNFTGCTPVGVAIGNTWDYALHKTDDATNYHTIKKVEDSCRAMISSYEADRLTYEQYKDSDNEEKRSWAEQAKMRANKTASTYNNYILENSFVWENNVPNDIKMELEYLN